MSCQAASGTLHLTPPSWPASSPAERIELTLVLRRRAELDASTVAGGTLSSAQLAERFGADPADVDALRAALPGIEILDVDAASRRVRIAGTAEQLADLFGVRLTRVRSADPSTGAPIEHRQREGPLSVPESLAGIVVAVLGLDDRPQTRAHLRVAGPVEATARAVAGGAAPAAAARVSYTPPQLANVYSMPTGTDGTGQTLAIIELGGGFGSSDLDTYFRGLGIPTPPSPRWASTAPRTSPVRIPRALTVRCCSTSRWRAPSRRRHRSSSTSPPIPTPDSSTG